MPLPQIHARVGSQQLTRAEDRSLGQAPGSSDLPQGSTEGRERVEAPKGGGCCIESATPVSSPRGHDPSKSAGGMTASERATRPAVRLIADEEEGRR
jgi:hypothetical protein